MLEAVGAAVIAAIEQELVKHAPEIQEVILKQLDNLASMIFDYVQSSLMNKSPDSSSTSEEVPQLHEE